LHFAYPSVSGYSKINFQIHGREPEKVPDYFDISHWWEDSEYSPDPSNLVWGVTALSELVVSWLSLVHTTYLFLTLQIATASQLSP